MVKKLKIYDISVMAVLGAILFAQEQLLANIAGVQLTVFLIVLYSKKLGFFKSSLIVIVHVILDNLFMGSFNILYVIPMLVGWILIPITLSTIFKGANSPIVLALLGILYSFIYCWLFIIPNYFILDIKILDYLVADILFEIILALVSFLTILWLYIPCSRILDIIMRKS